MFIRRLRVLCLFIFIGVIPLARAGGANDDENLVQKFKSMVPNTWKVRLMSNRGDCTIVLETEETDTVPSGGSNGRGTRQEPVLVRIRVLPRYTSSMLAEIHEHNDPYERQLKSIPRLSREGQELAAKMINAPQFQDARYGYEVLAPGRVPKRPEDYKRLSDVLHRIAADWRSVDDNWTVEKISNLFISSR